MGHLSRSRPAPPAPAGHFRLELILPELDRISRLKRLGFRAWHRGTKEADLLVGGFFDRNAEGWDEAQIAWFEALIDEEDVEIMAWAIGTAPWPERYAGSQAEAMGRLDYIPIPK